MAPTPAVGDAITLWGHCRRIAEQEPKIKSHFFGPAYGVSRSTTHSGAVPVSFMTSPYSCERAAADYRRRRVQARLMIISCPSPRMLVGFFSCHGGDRTADTLTSWSKLFIQHKRPRVLKPSLKGPFRSQSSGYIFGTE